MISRKLFVNKLRELGYQFKEQLHFQERYRLKGGTHIIHVPRTDKLEDDYVRSTLKQAGQSKDQIEELRTLELSIMPEGLENGLTDTEFVDLIAFLSDQK